MEKLIRMLTRNGKEIPLFGATLDIHKHRNGEKSSIITVHPNFKDDATVRHLLEELVDHIRTNHDMEDLV